jgi:hypothetical protein
MSGKHFIFVPGIRGRIDHPTTTHKTGTFLKIEGHDERSADMQVHLIFGQIQ